MRNHTPAFSKKLVLCMANFDYRKHLSFVISENTNFQIIDSVETLSSLSHQNLSIADYVLVRFSLKEMGPSFDFIQNCLSDYSHLKIIVISIWKNEFYINELIKHGVWGFYWMDDNIESLIKLML